MSRYKKLYEALLENGDLFELSEDMSGDWELDKKEFIRLQQEMEEIVNVTKVELDDEFED